MGDVQRIKKAPRRKNSITNGYYVATCPYTSQELEVACKLRSNY